jgi:soluble lytic murein transglycosylase-like protein
MQLMPGTAQALGVSDPWDIKQNIEGGTHYIKEQIDQFGDVGMALAAYNAGPGAVQKYNGIPPYQETQNYVQKVLKYFNEYQGSNP